jgi:hypothetical protein
MATLLKALMNLADIKSARGVALRWPASSLRLPEEGDMAIAKFVTA